MLVVAILQAVMLVCAEGWWLWLVFWRILQ